MLLNDFFKINTLSFDENELTSNISLNSEHAIFKGHFPENPVTPGVVQMQMVKELLEVYFEKKLSLKTMGRCKFLNVLSPNDTQKFDIKINIRESEAVLGVSAAGMKNEITFFKFNAVYQYS
jgi:3-hydroxyacyl-[acyl-carrier-protein] dehydratase